MNYRNINTAYVVVEVFQLNTIINLHDEYIVVFYYVPNQLFLAFYVDNHIGLLNLQIDDNHQSHLELQLN